MKSLQILKNWKRSVLTFSLVPLILIGVIYIVYGPAFDSYFSETKLIKGFFILPFHLSFFSSNNSLPFIVKIIGKTSIFYIYTTFLIWGLLFSLVSYIELSKQVAMKLNLLIELLLFTLVFYNIFPFSKLFVFTFIGFLIILLDLTVIILYWIYDLKSKR